MSRGDYFNLSSLLKLTYRNKLIRSRIIVCCIINPAIFFSIIILVGQHFPLSINYTFIFLLGWFYHSYVSIFAMSMINSYLKFLNYYGLELKILLIIYMTGLISSLVNSVILVGLISLNYLDANIDQVYVAVFFINFVIAPVIIWIGSFDTIRINLFGSYTNFYQPRPLHIIVILLSLVIVNVSNQLYNKMPEIVLVCLVALSVITAFSSIYISKKIKENFLISMLPK